MKMSDITNPPKTLNEGYKLTYHEIMALFDTIEKARYMPPERMVDKAKAAKDYVSNVGKSAKDAASDVGKTVGGVAKNAANAVGGYVNNFNNKANKFNNGRVEPTLNDSVMYEGWLSDKWDDASRSARHAIRVKKPIISAADLTKMWKDLGSPTDSDQIVRMLVRDVDMPKNMVMNAMKTASRAEPNVVAFADVVKRSGLTKQILAKCDTILSQNNISNNQEFSFNQNARTANKRNQRNKNRQMTWGESIGHVSPSITEEATIPDKAIKDIITQAVTKKLQNGASVGGTQEKVHDWAQSIKQETDAVVKMKLVKDIVNYLADIHGTDEWKKVVHGVDNIIKTDRTISDFIRDSQDKNDDKFQAIASANLASGKKMEKKMFFMTNDLLIESGISWSELSLKPELNGTDIMIYQTIKNTDMPVKKFISEMIMNKAAKEINTIGRAKKI